MRRIVVSLLKGGVAKSSSSVHLAHGMALAGYRVLLVDTDVQGHAGEILGVKPTYGLAEVICNVARPEDILIEARENLWLLAGGANLAAVKMEIARRDMAPEAVLDEALSPFDEHFDIAIMDTAPGWDTLLVNALYWGREVMAPVSMEPLSVSAVKLFEDRLAIIQKYNRRLELKWVVPTVVDRRVKKTAIILRYLMERYGPLVAPPIMYTAKLSATAAFGKTIFEIDPKGVGAECYHKLVKRVLADTPEVTAERKAARMAEQEESGFGSLRERLLRKEGKADERPEVAEAPRRSQANPLKERLERVKAGAQ